MSEEGEENEEIINAQSDEEIPEPEAEEPWQMQILHELLSLPDVENFSQSELQHVVSTHSALRQTLPSFNEAYANTFQGMHEQHLLTISPGVKPKTVPYSREF